MNGTGKDALAGASVLVTGGAGFIGSHLVERLVSMKAEVTVIDDLSSGTLENLSGLKGRIKFVSKSLLQDHVFDDIQEPAVVFHEAARALLPSFVDPVLDLSVNAGGTLRLLEFARKHDSRFVNASTGSIYGNPVVVPIREDHPLCPISPYATSKLAAENYCRIFSSEYGLKMTSLRYFNVYGPRQRVSEETGVIPIFVSRVLRGLPPVVNGTGKQTRDFLNVLDVVEANILAATVKGPKGECVNIGGGGKEISILDLAKLVAKILHSSLKPIFGPAKRGDIARLAADISLAANKLGYRPEITLQQGLYDYVKWHQSNYRGVPS